MQIDLPHVTSGTMAAHDTVYMVAMGIEIVTRIKQKNDHLVPPHRRLIRVLARRGLQGGQSQRHQEEKDNRNNGRSHEVGWARTTAGHLFMHSALLRSLQSNIASIPAASV
jgi:hypothetical protein